MSINSEKKKTIVITRFPYVSSYGGEESHTLSLADFFRRKGYEVVFMGTCSILIQLFREKNFPVLRVSGGKMIVTPLELIKSFFLFPFWILNFSRSLKILLKKYDIKAFYCLSLNEKLFLTPFLLKRNIPITWVEHQEIRGWLLKNPWKWLYKKYSKNVKIIPISRKNKEMLIHHLQISPQNIKDITNGIDLTKFLKRERNTKKNLIMTANRNIPKKGIPDFLKAIELLHRNDLDVRAITYFLKKENWYDLLSEADVYVSPARDYSETFSLNTAEALGAGCKVVVTRCSGIANYLTDHKNAFLVEPNNPKDMARGISEALNSPEEIRTQAVALAKEKFDQEKMFQAYESVILRS